jgi:glycosyltransferase involved in cell wall biosynthesis
MKILELTNYSAGICGVFQRAKQESVELSKRGHLVKIFSSNKTKGCEDIAPESDKIEDIEIKRFPAKKLGGESFLSWDFLEEAIKFKPDVVIAHAYRHLHTTKALRLKKYLNCKVFLVTHAPFVEKNFTRGRLSKIVVPIYDFFIGRKTINKFDKIISTTKWEEEHLIGLGAKKEKIEYIPNGIPDEFFKKNSKKINKGEILFFGRISPIKNIESLIDAFYKIKNKKITLKIVGSHEEPYATEIKEKVKKLRLERQIEFFPPVYELKKKIDLISSSEIFVLPSHRESMGQALIEAMSLGKIAISSKTKGPKEIIKDGENGLLFKIGDSDELAEKINYALDKKNKKEVERMQKNAKESVKKFNWDTLIGQLIELF